MFKICTSCKYEWKTLESFIGDHRLMLNGYQVNFGDPLNGFFLFTHQIPSCQSTISIPVNKFIPIARQQLVVQHFIPGLGACPKLCLEEKNLSTCPNKECPGSRIRELLNVIKTKLNSTQIEHL